MQKGIDFYYFSGTGNTKYIVNHMSRSLETYGVRVSLKSIENGYDSHQEVSELWIAVPANSQFVSPFIWSFLKSLPNSNGTPVYAIITLNKSAHILSPLYSLLESKGYVPTSACEISMPNNMVEDDFCQDKDQQKLKEASEKTDRFIQNTMKGNFSWESQFKGSKITSLLSRKTLLPWLSMRLMFRLETIPTRCIGCGICEKQCPIRNIQNVDGVFRHGFNCQFCMKCAASCPKKAIKVLRKESIKFQYTKYIK